MLNFQSKMQFSFLKPHIKNWLVYFLLLIEIFSHFAFLPIQVSAIVETNLDSLDTNLLKIDQFIGNEIQPYARITVSNLQTSQAVTLKIKAGTILHPTGNDSDTYFDLVLIASHFTLD